jgi:hypothetical protein
MPDDHDNDPPGAVARALTARMDQLGVFSRALSTRTGIGNLLDSPVMRHIEQLRRLREHFEKVTAQSKYFKDIIDQPNLRAFREQLARATKPMSGLGQALQDHDRLRDLVDPMAAHGLRSLIASNRAAHSQLGRFADGLAASSGSTLTTAAAFQAALGTQGIYAALMAAHCDELAKRVALSNVGISALAYDFGARTRSPVGWVPNEFAHDHSTLTIDIVRLAGEFGVRAPQDAPPIMASEVPAEVFRALDADAALNGVAVSSVVTSTRLELREQTSDALRCAIIEMEPGWVKMLDGARKALASENPDRLRQTSVSLRELFREVLHAIAPDEDAKRFVDDADREKGSPNRRARLRSVYAPLNAFGLQPFGEKDIDAILELFKLLNQGTHKDLPAGDVQARALVDRVEGTLLFLIRLARPGK